MQWPSSLSPSLCCCCYGELLLLLLLFDVVGAASYGRHRFLLARHSFLSSLCLFLHYTFLSIPLTTWLLGPCYFSTGYSSLLPIALHCYLDSCRSFTELSSVRQSEASLLVYPEDFRLHLLQLLLCDSVHHSLIVSLVTGYAFTIFHCLVPYMVANCWRLFGSHVCL